MNNTLATVTSSLGHLPMAHAVPIAGQPLSRRELSEKAALFANASVGKRFFGPGWIDDDGMACIVVISHDNLVPKELYDYGRCAMLAWRWNVSPSTIMSLTLMLPVQNSGPYVRWMRPSSDPVVQAIRRNGRFFMTVVSVSGTQSGWFEASFPLTSSGNPTPAVQEMWSIPTSGLPNSSLHHRFEPFRKAPYDDSGENEIPLWAEPVADQWQTLGCDGTWSQDLQLIDKAVAAWGQQAFRNRTLAAGFIQVVRERQEIDGVPYLVDSDGVWVSDGGFGPAMREIVRRAPSLGKWLAGIIGPSPDAKVAYDAAFETLHDGYACFCALDKLFPLVAQLPDEAVNEAFKTTFEAALLDWRITDTGKKRPWLANTGEYSLKLSASAIDLTAPLDDIANLWRTGFQIIDIIDTGLRIGAMEFPAPLKLVCDAFDNVKLEGSIADAEAKIQTLLQEAQVARQWSIPWGARVDLRFGPFVGLKIFESEGEFSCHFVDEHDRYFHVAIGLYSRPPNAATTHLLRSLPDDGGEVEWNRDAEVSLKLIAAAIVRDFLVVEERESVFSARAMKRRIRGREVRTIIYLPRVRYITPRPERLSADRDSCTHTPHQVAAHLRRSENASTAQRFLAQRYGMSIPEGFTFVRPHERGNLAEEARIQVYRSKSASKMIFNELLTAPNGSRPKWFEFERDCARMLSGRGMRVAHQAARRDGDGGVDLFAVDADGKSWIVQCKCWASHRPVGPDVIRELEGAIRLADKGSSSRSRGIVITTSTFTARASADAAALGFELINGEEFANISITKS